MGHQWIPHARFFESSRAQHAAIAAAARRAGGEGIVATVCEAVIETERDAALDDLRFRHRYERRLDAKLAALDARFRRELRGAFERFDVLGPAIWIARIIERVHADEDVIRADHFCPRERDRQ